MACPRRGLGSVEVGRVPVKGGPADPKVLGYVPREMTIGLHGLGCREILTSSLLRAGWEITCGSDTSP